MTKEENENHSITDDQDVFSFSITEVKFINMHQNINDIKLPQIS